jgi:hypothetical protein
MLSHPATGKSREKILVELVEADVDIGFGLIDDAKTYLAAGQAGFTVRVLQDVAGVIADIQRRLQQLGEAESLPFQALLAELRAEIAAMESAES